jgi:hypothetical protein|tara:strand:+ start:1606 stop:1809 length:204 start_codon:yes stop_codon:yes gene_type:complete
MQVFLGDDVTLLKEMEGELSILISGQVAGVVLDDRKQLERIWLHGMENSFWMSQGWKFIEEEDDGEI